MKRLCLITIILMQIIGLSLIAEAAPSKIYGHRPMKSWDYHKTNYDEDGNIRVEAKYTYFNLNKEVKKLDPRIPTLSTKDTDYGEDVEITFESKNSDNKKWQENIYKVVKLDTLTANPNLEEDIQFKVMDNKIILSSKSNSIKSNDIHPVKIYSKGFEPAYINIHVVKEGQLTIHQDFLPVEGMDLLFELKDFYYGITNPIYEVRLDGKKLKGHCEEYHIVSSLIRIENKGVKKLTPGKHTLEVKAYGFKTFKKTFIVDENDGTYKSPVDENENVLNELNKAKRKSSRVDIVASASKKGKSGGGSIMTTSNLVFDFDLISNAIILEKLGMDTDESKGVLKEWRLAIKDAVSGENDKEIFSYNDYINKCEEEKVQGKYLSFEEYSKNKDSKRCKDKLYQVKYLLEDGNYGQAQYFDESISLKSPKIKVEKAQIGEVIKLSFKNKEWAKNIQSLKVDSTTLREEEYAISDKEILVNPRLFTRNNRVLSISSRNYKTARINISLKAKDFNPVVEKEVKLGEHVQIQKLPKDFVKNLRNVKLNGKELNSIEATRTNWGYKVEGDKITLSKDLFNDLNRQTLTLTGAGYEDKIMHFNLIDRDAELKELKLPENIKVIVKKDAVEIDFKELNNHWRKNIEAVKVGPSWTIYINTTDFISCKNKLSIDKKYFHNGENFIEIKSAGYDMLNLKVEL